MNTGMITVFAAGIKLARNAVFDPDRLAVAVANHLSVVLYFILISSEL